MGPESQQNPSPAKSSNTFLIVLVVVALVLAYILYKNISNTSLLPPEYTETQNTPADSSNAPQLSADERAALTYPSDMTEEAWNAYLAVVAKIAVETDTLTIGPNCALSPVALKIPLGKEVTLQNNDTVPHSIGFTESLLYKAPANGTLTESSLFQIPANGTLTMSIDFVSKAGVYGYSCDQGRAVGGLIQVI